jgi:hypothetical protein
LEKRVTRDGYEKDETSKKEVSCSKKEITKDMVARWSERGEGCSKDVWTWRKYFSKSPSILLNVDIHVHHIEMLEERVKELEKNLARKLSTTKPWKKGTRETVMKRMRPRRRRRSLAQRRRSQRTWWPDGPRGAKDAPRMSGLGGSSFPRVHLNILLLYMCLTLNFWWMIILLMHA